MYAKNSVILIIKTWKKENISKTVNVVSKKSNKNNNNNNDIRSLYGHKKQQINVFNNRCLVFLKLVNGKSLNTTGQWKIN